MDSYDSRQVVWGIEGGSSRMYVEALNKLLYSWQPMNIVNGSAIILSGPRSSGRTFVAQCLNQFLR